MVHESYHYHERFYVRTTQEVISYKPKLSAIRAPFLDTASAARFPSAAGE